MSPGDSSITRPNVAIVFHETYLGCAPSIINAVRTLGERGFTVDVFIPASNDKFVAPPDLGLNARIITVGSFPAIKLDSQLSDSGSRDRSASGSNGISRQIKNRFSSSQRKRILEIIEAMTMFGRSLKPSVFLGVHRFSKAVRAKARAKTYAAIIGVDTNGLIAAHQMAALNNTPVLYWSLEIMFLSDRWTPMSRYLKRLERRFHQRSAALVIQDIERKESLCNENRATNCPTILVPNSPRGFLSNGISRRFFHDKFRLPDHQRVILHAGSVCEGMRSFDLAMAAGHWPESYRLIFHSHTPVDLRGQYAQSLTAAGLGKVLISSQPVDYDQLDSLVASSSIGLVIYDNSLGPNFQLLAGASGKLAHYLRCGVPVVSVGNASIGRVLAKYDCGIGVESVDEVLPAMEQIRSDESGYRRRATDCYREEYEFGKHFEAVVSLLQELCLPMESDESKTT